MGSLCTLRCSLYIYISSHIHVQCSKFILSCFCPLTYLFSFSQPHYVPDNYKRNGGRSAWKSERSKGAAVCDEDPSPSRSSDQLSVAFSRDGEVSGGRAAEVEVDRAHEDSSTGLTSVAPPQERRRATEEEDEEDDEEVDEEEERGEMEEESAERTGGTEALEPGTTSLLSSSPMHPSVLGRREAQRERLNKILLHLLHRAPSKNGERKLVQKRQRDQNELF